MREIAVEGAHAKTVNPRTMINRKKEVRNQMLEKWRDSERWI